MRELLFGPLRFGEIERGLPGISRSVLSRRLKRLQRDGIIEAVPEEGCGYRFTAAGEALRPVVQAMGEWVASWLLADPSPAELSSELGPAQAIVSKVGQSGSASVGRRASRPRRRPTPRSMCWAGSYPEPPMKSPIPIVCPVRVPSAPVRPVQPWLEGDPLHRLVKFRRGSNRWPATRRQIVGGRP